MTEDELLAARFEQHRARLRGVAYRMVGSLAEAEDAVQETWLNVSRAGDDGVRNLGGWLTTVTSRVCLDMLRSRASRREEPHGVQLPDLTTGRVGAGAVHPGAVDPGAVHSGAVHSGAAHSGAGDPEREAVLADSVGLALLVVLDTLGPAERLAFVLHDMFAVPFEEIAPVVGRSPAAARQLASRARRRVQGTGTVPRGDRTRQRAVVQAFLAAARGGDFEALVAVLDPDVVLRSDTAAAAGGAPEVRGATTVAGQALSFSQGAPFAREALVDGSVGFVVAPLGRLRIAFRFTIADDRIVGIDVVSDPQRLRGLELAVLEG